MHVFMIGQRQTGSCESRKRQTSELEYVRNAGFAMDAHIFLSTFGATLGKRWLGR